MCFQWGFHEQYEAQRHNAHRQMCVQREREYETVTAKKFSFHQLDSKMTSHLLRILLFMCPSHH